MAHMYACMYVSKYVCVYIYIHMHYAYTSLYMFLFMFMFIYVLMFMHIYIYIYIYIYVHRYMSCLFVYLLFLICFNLRTQSFIIDRRAPLPAVPVSSFATRDRFVSFRSQKGLKPSAQNQSRSNKSPKPSKALSLEP